MTAKKPADVLIKCLRFIIEFLSMNMKFNYSTKFVA
jgi:hypothetical protein